MAFLRRVASDVRLSTPVRDLSFVSSTGVFAPVRSLVSPLGAEAVDALDLPGLRALAQVCIIGTYKLFYSVFLSYFL